MNPFDEDDSSGEILEGFLCPICREDLKSIEFLQEHFERSHEEEQDALKSIFKDIFTKAKKKIGFSSDDGGAYGSPNVSITSGSSNSGVNSGNTNLSNTRNAKNARTRTNVFNFMGNQEIGASRNHMDYFQSIRNPRLERLATETNKLIIRLHKLLKDMPTDHVLRKQHERNIVTWLDGSSVKLCPSCAKSFHIARRQHHCRLCGSIMCDDCSRFLSIQTALELASLSMSQSDSVKQLQNSTSASGSSQHNSLRSCDHCLWLLETRQDMHESRTACPPISKLYTEIQKLRKDVMPDVEMYLKIIASLYEGESIFTINDASSLRRKIGQIAEAIDVRSKRVLALPCEPGTREESLKKTIRLSCIQLIKEKMLSLPPLPDEEEIRKIQETKRLEAERRIEREKRQAMEAYERYGLVGGPNDNSGGSSSRPTGDYAYGSDLHSLNNWSAHQASAVGAAQFDDPLIEQINIIKGYIKQARQDMNFDVVETLELNLRELQREFYERQRASARNSSTKVGNAAAASLSLDQINLNENQK